MRHVCSEFPSFPFLGLCVYFGYGIWHSKEGLRELQPKDMAARYVVLPVGALWRLCSPSNQTDKWTPLPTMPTLQLPPPPQLPSNQEGRDLWTINHQWANVILLSFHHSQYRCFTSPSMNPVLFSIVCLSLELCTATILCSAYISTTQQGGVHIAVSP